MGWQRPRRFVLLLAGALAVTGCRSDTGSASATDADGPGANGRRVDPPITVAVRDAALASARVWFPPTVPVPRANLGVNPGGSDGFREDAEVDCQFKLRKVGGTTPKFYCQLPSGEELKVKYGPNPELHAEVAASRLLSALGFGADRMFVVRKIRCAGCPSFPSQSLSCYERTESQTACFPGGIDYARAIDFDPVVIERKLDGRVIEASEDQGWGWYELDRIDPARGGSPRAEVDALRLMAVFLAHWDNKSTNQRLICLPGGDQPDGGCAKPFAIMQDLGATFGPTKIDLHNWKQGQVWKDGATCTVSMEHLPWGGGTFPERRIGEAGRQLLLGLLEQLSDRQLTDLFQGSRVTWHEQFSAEARRTDAWVEVFKNRVRQIRDAGPCPG